jgi:hypothetical protein
MPTNGADESSERRARLLCLLTWLVAGVAQMLIVVRAPTTLIVDGHDLSAELRAMLVQSLLPVVAGLLLVGASVLTRRKAFRIGAIILSALVYLADWIPLETIRKFGPEAGIAVLRIPAAIPELQWIWLLRNILLPAAFATAIGFAVAATIRQRAA